jgi:hypothetical protein
MSEKRKCQRSGVGQRDLSGGEMAIMSHVRPAFAPFSLSLGIASVPNAPARNMTTTEGEVMHSVVYIVAKS